MGCEQKWYEACTQMMHLIVRWDPQLFSSLCFLLWRAIKVHSIVKPLKFHIVVIAAQSGSCWPSLIRWEKDMIKIVKWHLNDWGLWNIVIEIQTTPRERMTYCSSLADSERFNRESDILIILVGWIGVWLAGTRIKSNAGWEKSTREYRVMEEVMHSKDRKKQSVARAWERRAGW